MGKACVAAAAAAVLLVLPVAPASAQVHHSCGNYGHTEDSGDRPVFTNGPIVGAGVEDIRTRVIGCPKARRMVKAFWKGRFHCNRSGLRCSFGSFRCRNRRLGDELWLARCFASGDRQRMLKFRFGA
jgi:hypothetical protein